MSKYLFNFEKLEIWQLGINLSIDIYKLTEFFPDTEKFGLTNQLRRASNSISANIAEGVARKSRKDKSRFVRIAYGSTMEVLSHVILAHHLGYITENQVNELRKLISELSNKINSFHKRMEEE